MDWLFACSMTAAISEGDVVWARFPRLPKWPCLVRAVEHLNLIMLNHDVQVEKLVGKKADLFSFGDDTV